MGCSSISSTEEPGRSLTANSWIVYQTVLLFESWSNVVCGSQFHYILCRFKLYTLFGSRTLWDIFKRFIKKIWHQLFVWSGRQCQFEAFWIVIFLILILSNIKCWFRFYISNAIVGKGIQQTQFFIETKV